ncbi:MAG: tRNA (adenosine(37)-N6)-threonylcarbamoyltransferase complex ATPase subunit type 1 TsaE [Gammaproteobacteria bacterium]
MTSEPQRKTFADEGEFVVGAAEVVRAWDDLAGESLLIGLQGPLGSGKTTWVRGMLSGLGYAGRVPSPTYTLVEQYPLDNLTVIHADLYRLDAGADRDLDALGIRDWLAREATWVLVEWPERSPSLLANADLSIRFESLSEHGRAVIFTPCTATGTAAIEKLAPGS